MGYNFQPTNEIKYKFLNKKERKPETTTTTTTTLSIKKDSKPSRNQILRRKENQIELFYWLFFIFFLRLHQSIQKELFSF